MPSLWEANGIDQELEDSRLRTRQDAGRHECLTVSSSDKDRCHGDRTHNIWYHHDRRKTYEHDVIIRLSGDVVKRKKKLSKKYYGTSHVVSKDEAKFVFETGCEQLILGSGQMGNVHLSPEAQAYFAKKGCKVLLQPTPEAIHEFNRSHAKKIGLFHVTC